MTNITFTLSFAHSEDVHEFTEARAAGEAFAKSNAVFRPRVIQSGPRGARVIARTVQVGNRIGKSAPTLDSARRDYTGIEREFWTAYHEKLASLLPA